MDYRSPTFRRILYSPSFLILVGCYIIIAFFGSLNDDLPHVLSDALCTPGLRHPLGCDAFGRDLVLLTLSSALKSSLFAILAVFFSCTIGTILGTLLSIAPEPLRTIGRRILDLILAFPSLLVALAWAALRGPGWDTLIFSLVVGTLPPFVRLIDVKASDVLLQDYVSASRTLGGSTLGILFRHQIPSLLNLNGIKIPHFFAHALLAEATLSFLGIGAPIGADTWGSLLNQGREYLIEAPHIAIGTGIPLFLTVHSLLKVSEKLGRIGYS